MALKGRSPPVTSSFIWTLWGRLFNVRDAFLIDYSNLDALIIAIFNFVARLRIFPVSYIQLDICTFYYFSYLLSQCFSDIHGPGFAGSRRMCGADTCASSCLVRQTWACPDSSRTGHSRRDADISRIARKP